MKEQTVLLTYRTNCSIISVQNTFVTGVFMRRVLCILLSLIIALAAAFGPVSPAAAKSDDSKIIVPLQNDYVPRIVQYVFGYNARTPLGFAYVGTEGMNSNNCAANYDVYLLPVVDLGLTAGDILICRNDKQGWSDGWLYNIYLFDENMKFLNKESNYTARGIPRSIELTEDVGFIGMKVIFGGYGNNLAFDKSDIPIEEFEIYKNTVSAENAVDYISLWNDMINYDESFNIRQKMFGHNVEWDYTITDNCSNSLSHRLEYYDIYDIDLYKTSDGKYIAAHDSAYCFSNMTFSEIKQRYPDIMTFEEVLEYSKTNNKTVFISTSNSEIRKIIEDFNMTDNVHYEKAFDIKAPQQNQGNNGHSVVQWSCIDSRHFNKTYIQDWQKLYNSVSLCTGGYSSVEYFTDEQIDWCIDKGVELGFAFFGGVVGDYRSNSLSVTAPYHFFKTHNKSVMNKLSYFMVDNEEYSELLIKAACRYAYGMNCDVYDRTPDLTDFEISTVSLSLESSITMNFKVFKSAAADFEKPYMVFNCRGDELIVTDYTEQGEYYVFSYPSISPQLMNDDVAAVLHATHNGIDYASPEKVMSVRTYAYAMLGRCNSDNYARLGTLLVDLLNYGAAAQKYTNYQTDTPVNADLTDEQKSWGTNTEPIFENIRDYNYKTVENPLSVWTGAGLVLNNSVMVRVKFSAENIENKTVRIICGKGEFTYSIEDFIHNKDGSYYVYCDEIFADEMSEEILLAVYDNNIQCSNTMRFSVESYAGLVHDNYAGSELDELTTAMMRYGNSAKAYGTQNDERSI